MIAIESFRRFRLIDLIVIILFAIFWLVTNLVTSNRVSPQTQYIVSLFFITFFMSCTVYVIRKAGAVTLFYLLCGLFTFSLNNLGTTGLTKLLTLVISGVLFELTFIILKLELKSIPLDVIVGTAVSAASIPISTGLLLSPVMAQTLIISILNLALLSFFIGIVSGLVAFLIWYYLRTTKLIVSFEYQ